MRKESLDKYKNKLAKLKQERIIVAQDFQDWVNDGDGFHDSPMMAGKKAELDYLNSEIFRLENLIRESGNNNIENVNLKNKTIKIGSKIKLLDIDSDMKKEITLVTSEEAGLEQGFVSIDSPLGQSVSNKTVGETINITLPTGAIKRYKISRII